MRNRTFMIVLAAALAVCVTGLAFASPALAAKRPHPTKLAYPALKLATPQATEISLSNGLTGFVVEDHEIPVVDVAILVKTYFPDKSKFGLNDMAQWVIRNGGTATWPGDKLNDELEYLAASMEVYGGGLTTMFAFNCIKKDLPRVLDIFADLVMNPAFPEDKIEMRRNTMLEDIRRRNDEPSGVSRREYAQLIYGDHPYAWETTPESVKGLTRDDLVNIYKTYFHPNNAIIGISGDVTKDEIVAALESALANWQPADVTVSQVPDMAAPAAPTCNYIYMDINQAYISMGHEGINLNNPDRCAVNIMNFILGGGSFTSWITEKVRSDEGLAYSANSRYSADPWVKGLFSASAQTKADACSRAITIIQDQIKRMRETGPTEKEVKKAIETFVNSQVFDYESKAQVVRRLIDLRYQGRPLDSPERDIETYGKLTVADIRNAAQKYLRPDDLTLLVVGNKELFDRPLSEFGTVNEIELKKE
jgi:predicted Zn-dependent peptidase